MLSLREAGISVLRTRSAYLQTEGAFDEIESAIYLHFLHLLERTGCMEHPFCFLEVFREAETESTTCRYRC